MVAAGTCIGFSEGYKELAYQDSGGVWTICYGETDGVYKGMRATRSDCEKMLQDSIAKHSKALQGLPDEVSDVQIIGAIDLVYNIGVGAFNKSTAKKRLINKDYEGASAAVLWFKYVNKVDCSKRNSGCYGIWPRRQWQAKAINNEYKTVDEALRAHPNFKEWYVNESK